jgi:type II secretion system protein C
MNPASRELLMALLTRLGILFLAAKAAAMVLLWLLPGEGVSMAKTASVQPAYHRYTLGSMLAAPAHAERGGGVPAILPSQSDATGLILKGLYGKETEGYVIIAQKSKPETTEVVTVGETFHGYTLRSIHPQSAVFEYRGESYRVAIEDAAELPDQGRSPAAPEAPAETVLKQISRDQVNSYTKNLDLIWRDIGIREVRKGKRIEGFRIVRIKPGTPFAALGLKRNDVIIKANNKPLNSYAAAMEVYQEIDRLKAVELVILRKNQEKELVYEIY